MSYVAEQPKWSKFASVHLLRKQRSHSLLVPSCRLCQFDCCPDHRRQWQDSDDIRKSYSATRRPCPVLFSTSASAALTYSTNAYIENQLRLFDFLSHINHSLLNGEVHVNTVRTDALNGIQLAAATRQYNDCDNWIKQSMASPWILKVIRCEGGVKT